MPWTVHGFLEHILFLVVTTLVILQIYRLRGGVAAVPVQWGKTSRSAFTRYLPWRALATSGHHILAAWVGLVFVVWAVGVRGGAVLLTRGMVVTLLALLAVRAFRVWLDRSLMPHSETPVEESVESEPEPRPTSRVLLVTALRIAALLVALVLALEAWGLDVLGWLQTSAGRATISSVTRIAVVLAVVALIAKAVQAASAR
jgi:small conductance mechanosensitive channel